jgi:hypothetical protein
MIRFHEYWVGNDLEEGDSGLLCDTVLLNARRISVNSLKFEGFHSKNKANPNI